MKPLTADILTAAIGLQAELAALWLPHIIFVAGEADLSTPARLGHWLVQTAHESQLYTHLEENLNYSTPEQVCKTFRGGFDIDKDKIVDPEEIEFAKQFLRQPQKLGNRAYANKNGNGDEVSGDGWRFRARGPIGITGRSIYLACGKALGVDLIANPDLLAKDLRMAARSAGWYWTSRSINRLADAGDIMAVTKAVNGGYNGIEDRKRLAARALPLLQEVSVVLPGAGLAPGTTQPMRLGDITWGGKVEP